MFVLLFASLAVPAALQRRVLYFGVVGALMLRGGFIAAGGALIDHISWVFYVFGALVLLAGARMFRPGTVVDPQRNFIVRGLRRVLPVTDDYAGCSFYTRTGGKMMATPHWGRRQPVARPGPPAPAGRAEGTGASLSALTSLQVGSPISYAIAVVIPALDAILPVLPSETAVIALGVATAGSTDPRMALLVACAAAGAFLGDNLCYVLGCRFGPRAERRFFSTQKGARRRAWAEHALQRFGMQVIIVCRFIPGGRTAVTLSCGLIGYPRRRFITATAIAGIIWALYAFFIGRLGGKAFEDKPWAGFLVAFGITIVISSGWR